MICNRCQEEIEGGGIMWFIAKNIYDFYHVECFTEEVLEELLQDIKNEKE